MLQKKVSLAAKYPEIAKQWHPYKNGDLTPDRVAPTSDKMVWWQYPYDDPITGKHFDFEWPARIVERSYRKRGCPYLCGKKVWKGFNDLETLYPDLAKEWHPTRNGNLTPDMVTPGSTKNVWWWYPYDDPVTGKHFDFEWPATICDRTYHKSKCPYLNGTKVWIGFNDLKTHFPSLAKEWHPDRNGSLTPDQVTYKSSKKVWWILPYDDPITGNHFNFEWKDTIYNRSVQKFGCPFLTGKKVWKGFNDLETRYPDLAKEWHPDKNGDITPDMITFSSSKEVWWKLSYIDPITGKHFDFEWPAKLYTRTILKAGCPFLTGQKVWKGFNDLETLYPDLAKEWHPTRNGNLTPDMVAVNSNKTVWWQYPYDDPITGKHFDFEWPAKIIMRTARNTGCPFLSGTKAWKGFNDLETLDPVLAKEWHQAKNGNLTPDMVTLGSNKLVWWKQSYIDPITGKQFVFEWPARINKRAIRKEGCPYINGRKVWKGYNDLETQYPSIASEWHPTLNRKARPDNVLSTANKKVWWKCTAGHEWYESILMRTSRGCNCPECQEILRRSDQHYEN